MKKTNKQWLYKLLLVTSIAACKKTEPVTVSFDVQPNQLVLEAGDSIQFQFQGNADVLTFYSGETGRLYKNRNRTEAEDLKLELSIASRVLYGSQDRNVKLMYSTAFNGDYTAAGIREEQWTDISNDFTWSTAAVPNGIAATTTNSGPVDISKYLQTGKPIYFAYRYESQATTSAAQGGRSWRLPVFNLNNIGADGTISPLATIRTAGWKIVPVLSGVNRASFWTVSSTDPFLFFTPNGTLEPHIHWVVTSPFKPSSVKPDKPLTIKNSISLLPPTYTYTFAKAGTYEVTFVAKNVDYTGEKEVVKSFEVQVKEKAKQTP